MKHLAIHLVIALMMFVIGTTTHTLLSVRNDAEIKANQVITSREDEEREITGVVFRQQIGDGYKSLTNTYYLSCYNYADPSDKLLARLARTMPPHQLRVMKLSELQPDQYPFDANKIFLRVGRISWINESEVMVGGSYRSGWGAGQAYVYHVVREKGVWRVKSSETIS